MNTLRYVADNEHLIKQLDNEFQVVTLLDEPSPDEDSGWKLIIFDQRSKKDIEVKVQRIVSNPGVR